MTNRSKHLVTCITQKICLCVDNFGVKCFNQTDKTHLIDALKSKYEITVDETGKNFCGLTLDWNYVQGYVDVSMPDFVRDTLKKIKL